LQTLESPRVASGPLPVNHFEEPHALHDPSSTMVRWPHDGQVRERRSRQRSTSSSSYSPIVSGSTPARALGPVAMPYAMVITVASR
jgi:hypothetical protein